MAVENTLDFVEKQEQISSTMDDKREKLIQRIESFRKRRKISATAFGYVAMGDPAFLRKLRAGRVPRPKTVEKVKQFMRQT